jgi:uncharacterized small protein (DUF1192 family)
MDYKAVDNKLEITESKVVVRSIEDIKRRIKMLNGSISTLQAEIAIEQAQLDKCTELGIKEASEIEVAPVEEIEE